MKPIHRLGILLCGCLLAAVVAAEPGQAYLAPLFYAPVSAHGYVREGFKP